MNKTIVWREEWNRPYDPWSIIENIKIANSLTGNDLLFYVADKKGGTHENKLSEESHTQLKDLTSIDFHEINQIRMRRSKVERNNPSYNFHTQLYYCLECIHHNYHSYLHQYNLINLCPFHLVELKSRCNVCHRNIDYTKIAFHTPFTCKCGMQLYQSSENPIWKNWTEFKPIITATILDENYELLKKRHSLHIFRSQNYYIKA